MATLLHISASPRHAASVSRRIAAEFIARLRAQSLVGRVIERDLSATTMSLPGKAFVTASIKPDASRSEADRAALRFSETLIAELETADVVLVSTAMHNFTVPASLKSWIDHVVRPGRTFKPTPNGKVGLLHNRPVFVMSACGGAFEEGLGDKADARQPDFLTPYLKAVFGVIGMHNVQCLRLDNCLRGEAQLATALSAGRMWIDDQCRRLSADADAS